MKSIIWLIFLFSAFVANPQTLDTAFVEYSRQYQDSPFHVTEQDTNSLGKSVSAIKLYKNQTAVLTQTIGPCKGGVGSWKVNGDTIIVTVFYACFYLYNESPTDLRQIELTEKYILKNNSLTWIDDPKVIYYTKNK